LKNDDDLSPLLFSFVLEYAIRRVQENHDDLRLSDKYRLLFYADDVNVLGGSVHIVDKNTEVLVVVSKEIGLEVNADETNYMIMSRVSECKTKSQYKV
jgi:hypothetical protein